MTAPGATRAITDLHNHLVPGVDDGAATVAESLEALRVLRSEGVVRLVTTPHILLPRLDTDAAVERELDRQRRAFDTLRVAAAARDDVPAFALGQEIWAPDAEQAARIARHPTLGLGATGYLLIEFGFDLRGDHADVVAAVLDGGHRVIVAHPERYAYRPEHDPIETMQRWRELGALLQVNVGSFGGHYVAGRPRSEELAWQMVELGLADLLATDHHGPRRTGVSPAEAYDALVERGFASEAHRLMELNPGAIARGETVTPLSHPVARAGEMPQRSNAPSGTDDAL
jgi:protein-tyrosine phosphatase